MNIYQKACFAVALIGHLFTQQNLFASNLDGTSTLIFKPQHHVFSNNESAIGLVRMGGGFTIKAGANARLDTVVSVSGAIDLRETGILQLLTDLKLDNNLTWSSGGYINGRGKGIILNGSLSIPASKTIHIIGDTIIDGQGSNLILNNNAQIIVESNATLTLRNLTLKNTRHNPFNPCLKVAGNSGKLALDNVNLAITGDMQFAQGQLYIHNDVIFSGTSAFIYASTAPCFIAPGGTFLFDFGTTFSFAPRTKYASQLFVLQNRNATLYLNGCTLKTTNSGMRMTSGNLILDNKITLESPATGPTNVDISTLSAQTSQDYGNIVFSCDWISSGKILAVGGDTPVNGAGGFSNTNELRLYSFDGTTLTPLTSQDFGTRVYDVAWNPSGTVLAIGGRFPVSGAGGFSNTDELRLYSFNGSSLTPLASANFGNHVRKIAWHPNGEALAIVGENPVSGGGFSNTDELRLYSFDGTTLTTLTSQDYGGQTLSIAWNPSGTVLAVGGQNPTSGLGGFSNTDELRLYSFDGTTLTALTSQDYGGELYFITWSPSGTVLAIGGRSPGNGVGGFNNTDELRLYSFDGTTLTALTSQDYGTNIGLYTGAWHPDETAIVIGGQSPVNGAGGFSNTNEIRLYSTNFISKSSQQSISKSIVFGNSALGSAHDLNVEVLGGAHVIVDGQIVDDSA